VSILKLGSEGIRRIGSEMRRPTILAKKYALQVCFFCFT
jgi:hypothetical protein